MSIKFKVTVGRKKKKKRLVMVKSNATVVLYGASCCVCSNSRGMVAERPPFVFRTALQWCKPAVTDHMTAFTARWGSAVLHRPSAHKHAHPTVTLLANALRPHCVTAGSRLAGARYCPFVSNWLELWKISMTVFFFSCCEVSYPLGDQLFLVQLRGCQRSSDWGKNKDW